jgi:DNA-binding transcriptional ArsR family regulator
MSAGTTRRDSLLPERRQARSALLQGLEALVQEFSKLELPDNKRRALPVPLVGTAESARSYMAVLWLHERGGLAPLDELREYLGLTQATVSQLIGRLKSVGLVRPVINDANGRYRDVLLTAEGVALLRKAGVTK